MARIADRIDELRKELALALGWEWRAVQVADPPGYDMVEKQYLCPPGKDWARWPLAGPKSRVPLAEKPLALTPPWPFNTQLALEASLAFIEKGWSFEIALLENGARVEAKKGRGKSLSHSEAAEELNRLDQAVALALCEVMIKIGDQGGFVL